MLSASVLACVGCSSEVQDPAPTQVPPAISWGKADGSALARPLNPDEIIGSLAYGEGMRVDYTSSPELRAISFTGRAGDVALVDMQASSDSEATAIVVLVDKNQAVLGGGVGFARATLPEDGLYYAVVYEPQGRQITLDVQLNALIPVAPKNRLAWRVPEHGGEHLSAVWVVAPEDVWAAGPGGLVLHWNGQSIQRHDLHLQDASVQGLWARSSHDVTAVFSGKVYQFDGTAWHQLTSQPGLTHWSVSGMPETQGQLWFMSRTTCDALWCSGGDTFASRWSGQRWLHHKSESFSQNWVLPHRLVAGYGQVWIFGRYQTSQEHCFAEVFDGATWRKTGPIDGTMDGSIGGAVLFGRDRVAVSGSSTNQGFAVAFDGSEWNALDDRFDDIGYDDDLGRIWGTGPDNLWLAGGDFPKVFRKVGNNWSAFQSPDTNMAIHGGSDGIPWFAGSSLYRWNNGVEPVVPKLSGCGRMTTTPGGNVLVPCGNELVRFDGAIWTRESIAPLWRNEALRAVWAESDTALWLTTSRGRVLRKEGSSLVSVAEYLGSSIDSISGTSGRDVWVGGTQKLLAHWNGAAFAPVNLVGAQGTQVVMARSSTEVYALDSTHAYVFDGTSWQSHLVGEDLRDLWAASPSDVWVSGKNGLSHWDGFAWTQHQPKPVRGNTYYTFVAVVSSSHGVFALEDNGSLYRFNNQSWEPFDWVVAAGRSLHMAPNGHVVVSTAKGVLTTTDGSL